jgi:hypothetical protein
MATSYYIILQRGHCCCCCCPCAGGTAGRRRPGMGPGMGPAAAPAPPAAASAARPAWALASASSRWKKTKIYIISQYSEISKITNVPELHKVCSFQSFKCTLIVRVDFLASRHATFTCTCHVQCARGGGGARDISHLESGGRGGGGGRAADCFVSCPVQTWPVELDKKLTKKQISFPKISGAFCITYMIRLVTHWVSPPSPLSIPFI